MCTGPVEGSYLLDSKDNKKVGVEGAECVRRRVVGGGAAEGR